MVFGEGFLSAGPVCLFWFQDDLCILIIFLETVQIVFPFLKTNCDHTDLLKCQKSVRLTVCIQSLEDVIYL